MQLTLGPCVYESPWQIDECVRRLRPVGEYLFKVSWRKANRTSADSYVGLTLMGAVNLFEAVKRQYGQPVTTDVHEEHQVMPLADWIDVFQVPAFLCRQTDLLREVAWSGRPVAVKKGQFLSPADCFHVVDKLNQFGASDVTIIERGSTFGYNNLVVDMRAFAQIKETGATVLIDCTHSVQLPGAGRGQMQFADAIARAAIAAGADGVFAECHPSPQQALSDSVNMFTLNESFLRTVERWKALHACVASL